MVSRVDARRDASVDVQPDLSFERHPYTTFLALKHIYCSGLLAKRRSRRNMSRASRLAELRALRAAGKTRLSTYQVDEAEAIYDEVDDDGYKQVVRSRLDRDDFVVEDNGEGYADDGREEWQNDRRYESESEDELPARGKAGTAPLDRRLCMRTLTTNHSQEET